MPEHTPEINENHFCKLFEVEGHQVLFTIETDEETKEKVIQARCHYEDLRAEIQISQNGLDCNKALSKASQSIAINVFNDVKNLFN